MKLNKVSLILIAAALLLVWTSQGYAQDIGQLLANRNQLLDERQQLNSEIPGLSAAVAYWEGEVVCLKGNYGGYNGDAEWALLMAEIHNLENEIFGYQFAIWLKGLELDDIQSARAKAVAELNADLAAILDELQEIDDRMHDEIAFKPEDAFWSEESLYQYNNYICDIYNNLINETNADCESEYNSIMSDIANIEEDISNLQSSIAGYYAQMDALDLNALEFEIDSEAIANAEEALYQARQNLSIVLQALYNINIQIVAIEVAIVRLGGSF